jgi:hypothetical protein
MKNDGYGVWVAMSGRDDVHAVSSQRAELERDEKEGLAVAELTPQVLGLWALAFADLVSRFQRDTTAELAREIDASVEQARAIVAGAIVARPDNLARDGVRALLDVLVAVARRPSVFVTDDGYCALVRVAVGCAREVHASFAQGGDA